MTDDDIHTSAEERLSLINLEAVILTSDLIYIVYYDRYYVSPFRYYSSSRLVKVFIH